MKTTKKVPTLRFPEFEGEWGKKQLREVCDVIMGSSPKSSSYNENNYGLPLIQGNADITNRVTTPRIYTSEITKTCDLGDILLSVRAPVGSVAKSNHHACIGRGVCTIKSSEVSEFVYQFLINFEKKWGRLSQGSTFDSINRSDIESIFISIPSFPEQQKIADCLTAMDDTIEAQQQKVEQLQAYKKGLLQQLFSQTLRFPGFEGEWEEKKLGEVLLSVTTGLNPRDNFILGDGDNFYITIKNIKNGKLYLETAEKIDNAATQTINKRSDLRAGDVLFSSIGNVGDMYIIEEDPKKWNINESVFSLRPNTNSITSKQLYYSIQNPAFMNLLRSGVTGSTFKSVKIGFLKNIKLDLPSLPEQQKIADCLSTLDEVIELEQQKLEKLQVYKKGLLQQLFV